MICPRCKLDTLNEEKDMVVCSDCDFKEKTILWEYRIWKKIFKAKLQKREKSVFHKNEETHVTASPNTLIDAAKPRKNNEKKMRPTGFYILIVTSMIIGLFAGGVVISLILAANWVAIYLPTQSNITVSLLFGVLASAAFLFWLIRKTLRERTLRGKPSRETQN